MNCALWLNRRKIYRACEIPENLDVASLRGYFLAGSLVEWLRANGGGEYAEKLSELSPDDDALNQKLAAVFGSDPLPVKTFGSGSDIPPADTARFAAPPTSSLSSYPISPSYSFPRFPSSYSFSSFSSFFENFGSFWQFLQTGSFGSFAAGSYSQWAWLFALLSRSYGSFTFGSFASFHEWEWEWLFKLFGGYGSFGSFYFGSFGSLTVNWLSGFFGSFSPSAFLPNLSKLDEYDRIMLETLMNCPLDRFGYGIHNI